MLAVSLGDPAGVGPELFAQAWIDSHDRYGAPFAVIGGADLLVAAARSRGIDLPVARVSGAEQASAVFANALPVLGDLDGAWHPGQPSRAGAELALASLTQAAERTVSGEFAALVTGPIAKARLAEIGFDHPGQTEFVATAAGIDPADAVMMLAGPQLRTVPLTVHIPLAEVPMRISSAMIERKARIVALALMRDFGIARPRLAIAGLNPHAGEEGRIGDEEARLIAPAIAHLEAEGIAVSGPHPADALFAPRARTTYDAALCMYHDQALIPLKALDFDQGVNITLGLPIIRTSPDHGTAFAIAGKNVADPGATRAALRMAAECAVHRFGA